MGSENLNLFGVISLKIFSFITQNPGYSGIWSEELCLTFFPMPRIRKHVFQCVCRKSRKRRGRWRRSNLTLWIKVLFSNSSNAMHLSFSDRGYNFFFFLISMKHIVSPMLIASGFPFQRPFPNYECATVPNNTWLLSIIILHILFKKPSVKRKLHK